MRRRPTGSELTVCVCVSVRGGSHLSLCVSKDNGRDRTGVCLTGAGGVLRGCGHGILAGPPVCRSSYAASEPQLQIHIQPGMVGSGSTKPCLTDD